MIRKHAATLMSCDVPIVIRVLALLRERASSFPVLHASFGTDDDAPTADGLFTLVDAMRREGWVEWKKLDGAGVPIRAKVTEGRDAPVLHEITEAGRAALGRWETLSSPSRWSIEDHPGQSFLIVRAVDEGAADEAVCAFGSVLPQVHPVEIVREAPSSGTGVQRRVKYEVVRTCLGFDAASIRLRALTERWDIPWTEADRIVLETSLAPVDPWVVIETTQGAKKNLDEWGWGHLLDFAESIAGPPKQGLLSACYWDRRLHAGRDLRAAYARFWETDQIAERKRRGCET
jgi:hypothetical protein